MVSFLTRSSVPFLVAFAMLALTVPEVHGQSRVRPTRQVSTLRQFPSNRTTIGRTRTFFTPTPFGFDPFLRDRRSFDPFLRREFAFDPFLRREFAFDPFLRREFAFDPFLRREFAFDPFLRRRFSFDPFLGIGVFGFPASAVTPFFFAGLNGF